MSKQTLKERLEKFFSDNPEDANIVKEVVTEKFETVELIDGTKLTIEPAVEVGAAIVLNDKEGEPVPAPVGEYELNDGRVVIVEAEGVIAMVNEPSEEGEDEPVVEEPMAEEGTEQDQKVKRIIESIVSEKIFNLEKENKFFKEENEVLTANMTEVQEAFEKFKTEQLEQFEALKTFTKEVLDELLDEPAQTPVKEKFNLFPEKKKNIFLTDKN